jgi:uncharacterized phage protein (TIGR01671 family)
MTRDIKFRVFDKETKTIKHLRMLEDFSCQYVKRNIETLMQYTGLKDINGNDIYEGDILEEKPMYQKTQYRIVEIKGIGIEPFISSISYSNTYGGASFCYPNRCKCVGNIYENKELIKENI